MILPYGLTVVMEGIETEAQLAFSRDAGCNEFQGFLFSKLVAAHEFETLLART